MEDIVSAYHESCKEVEIEPKEFFLDIVEKSFTETQNPPLNINLSGHQTPLFNNRITNSDISCILTTITAKQIPISHLNLSCNELDDGCVPYLEEFLSKNSSLRSLNLTANSFTPEGIARLIESLMSNFFLESLILDENDVGEIGGLRIGVLLEKNISIRQISLYNTNLTVRSILSILQSTNSHSSLLMYSMSHISGKYHDLPDLSQLYFRLQNCTYLNSNLKRLHLPYCKLRDEGLEYLVRGLSLNKHSSVEVLDVKGNEISVDGAKVLCHHIAKSKYCRIKVLDLSFNRIQTVGVNFFVGAFKRNEGLLEGINFSSNGIGDIGLYHLANVIKNANPETFPLRKLYILKNNLFEQRSKKAFFELYKEKGDVLEMDMTPYCNQSNEDVTTYYLAREKESDDFLEDVDSLKIIDDYKKEITDMIENERRKN